MESFHLNWNGSAKLLIHVVDDDDDQYDLRTRTNLMLQRISHYRNRTACSWELLVLFVTYAPYARKNFEEGEVPEYQIYFC
jgi:hypothetical protein